MSVTSPEYDNTMRGGSDNWDTLAGQIIFADYVDSVTNKPLIKIAGEWVQSTPYVKVSGIWVESVPYVKVSGIWTVVNPA